MKCSLCLQEKKLVKSHIIPEFCFKPVYDDKIHEYHILSTAQNENNYKRQKGIWERLLCWDCEQYLSRFETYAAKIIREDIYKRFFCSENPILISGIDYQKFKIFQLSILWRASISKNTFYSGVNLGPHEDKIREMILHTQPGHSYEYGCHMIALIEKSKVINGFIWKPDSCRISGHYGYRFILCGCIWGFVVSSRTKNFKGYQLFLSEDGHLLLSWEIAKNTDLLSGLAQELSNAGKLT